MTYTMMPDQTHSPTDEETMSVIRSVLTENADNTETARKPAKVRRTKPMLGFSPRTKYPTPRRRADDLPPLARAGTEDADKSRAAQLPQLLRAVTVRALRYRPTPRQMAFAAAALLILLRPHWVLLGLVLTVMLGLGLFLIIGPDRVWRIVMAYLRRVDLTDPDKAVSIRARLDRFACRWDGFLDLLPEGSVDGLYLPDFMGMAERDAQHTSAMAERFDRMMQQQRAGGNSAAQS